MFGLLDLRRTRTGRFGNVFCLSLEMEFAFLWKCVLLFSEKKMLTCRHWDTSEPCFGSFDVHFQEAGDIKSLYKKKNCLPQNDVLAGVVEGHFENGIRRRSLGPDGNFPATASLSSRQITNVVFCRPHTRRQWRYGSAWHNCVGVSPEPD